jgi:DNA-binding transcriptional ArsR family regulator
VAAPDALDVSLLKAFGHPLRMRLLTLITERGEASPVELSRELGQPLATVSHHTRVLRDLGYIELSRTEPRRGAVEHYYRATTAPFLDDRHWEQLPAPLRRGITTQIFRQIFSEAATAGPAGGFDAAGSHLARMMLELDARGWRELSQAVLALLKRAQAIQERSDDRRRNARRVNGEALRPSELAILHFAVAEPAGPPEQEPERRQRRGRSPRIP